MINDKKSRKEAALTKKKAIESLRFQTHWGLKQLGENEGSLLHRMADVEVEHIVELGLEQDILSIKRFLDDIKYALHISPVPDSGDFTRSIVTLALGIGSISDISKMKLPTPWIDQIKKKILAVVFPKKNRHEIISWAKNNGYNTSTYLGQPIVKFQQIYILIKRNKNEEN